MNITQQKVQTRTGIPFDVAHQERHFFDDNFWKVVNAQDFSPHYCQALKAHRGGVVFIAANFSHAVF